MPQKRPSTANPHWIQYDLYGDATLGERAEALGLTEWTMPVMAGPSYGYSQEIEDAVEANASIDWHGAKDLSESPWFSDARYVLKRRYQLPAINAVVYFKVLPLLGFMGPIASSHPIQAAADWASVRWSKLSGWDRGLIKIVAPLSAEGWHKLANAIIDTVRENRESLSQADRRKLMGIAETALSAMDTCVTLAETVANNTGLRPLWVTTWGVYRQLNILVGLGDPGDAQGASGGSKDLAKHGPWLLRNLNWLAPLALLAMGGIYLYPIVQPLLSVAGKARERATRETKRLESKATVAIDSDLDRSA